MSSSLRRRGAVLLALALSAAPAAAQGPVYKDRERFERVEERETFSGKRRVIVEERTVRFPTGPRSGYVGSAWGLGKPNYYGLSPRPDDGGLY